MSVSLAKRTDEATASLVNLLKAQVEKGIDLGDLTAQVQVAVDFSISMSERYRNGEVQDAVERALALSMSGLDDDKLVPVHFFDHRAYPAEVVGEHNYQGFVSLWAASHQMGATNYAPTISNILGVPAKKKRLGRKPSVEDRETEKDADPTLVLIVTDGNPSDRAEVEALLIQASSRPFFWQFIGLGDARELSFLQHLNNDDLPGRVIDNVGVTIFADTTSMPDTAFFNDVIGEFFTQWLPEARRLGITRK